MAQLIRKRPFHRGETSSSISCVMHKIILHFQAFGFSSRSLEVRSSPFSSPHPEAVHQSGRHDKDDTAQSIKNCAGTSCVRKNNFCFFVLDRSSITDRSCSASRLSVAFLNVPRGIVPVDSCLRNGILPLFSAAALCTSERNFFQSRDPVRIYIIRCRYLLHRTCNL